jgi:hypothetical protein
MSSRGDYRFRVLAFRAKERCTGVLRDFELTGRFALRNDNSVSGSLPGTTGQREDGAV